MSRLLLLFLLPMLVACPGTTIRASASEPSAGDFNQLDCDKDGSVSWSELYSTTYQDRNGKFQSFTNSNLSQADVSKDLKLSLSEFKNMFANVDAVGYKIVSSCGS